MKKLKLSFVLKQKKWPEVWLTEQGELDHSLGSALQDQMMKRLRSSHFSQNHLVSAYLDHQCVELGIWRKHDNGYTETVDFPKATKLRIILVLRRTSARLTAFSFLFSLFFLLHFLICYFCLSNEPLFYLSQPTQNDIKRSSQMVYVLVTFCQLDRS